MNIRGSCSIQINVILYQLQIYNSSDNKKFSDPIVKQCVEWIYDNSLVLRWHDDMTILPSTMCEYQLVNLQWSLGNVCQTMCFRMVIGSFYQSQCV